MSFIAPLFFVGLAALAIPVLLHLIQRERKNVVQFPSLMFLQRIPYQSVRRRRIRNWLLLAMRLAALALIVLAFARPYFPSSDVTAAAAAGAREVVVLLDRSYSMAYGDRWSRALGAARDAINGLTPSDRGSVVLFASGAEVALRSTSDRSRLLSALTGLEAGADATRYGPALKLAGSILSESALPRKEVVLITDFQRRGWQGAQGVRLPEGAVLTPVSLAEPDTANLAVTPVSLQRSSFSDQQRLTVTAGVRNHGAEPVSNVDLVLELNGRPIQTQRVNVEAYGSASTSFEPVTLEDAHVRAAVRLPDDQLDRDNAFYFVIAPEEPIRVVLVERSGAPRETSLYLSRALAVGDSPRFEVSVRQADSVTAEALQNASVVILNDAPVGQTTADRLASFVERGGGLLMVSGEQSAWPSSGGILPAVAAAPVDRSTGTPGRLGALEYGHPVFEIFRAPRSGDFSAARFYGYRSVTPAPGSTIVARFDDGAPALLEKQTGSGRVLMWTSTLDLFWNDLALKPVFLPFVHRAVRHLAGYREPTPWRTVGEVMEPPTLAEAGAPAAARVVLTPSGERLALDAEGPEVLALASEGFYEVREGREATLAGVVASNVDLSESDMTPVDPAEVVAAATGRADGNQAAAAAQPPSDQAQEAAQRIWWYVLFAGLLLLGAETVVGNRLTM